MVEYADIAVINGEDIDDVSPWEFDFIVEDPSTVFSLDSAAAIHGTKGYKLFFGGDVAGNTLAGNRLFTGSDIYLRPYFRLPSGNYPNRTETIARAWQLVYLRDIASGSYAAVVEFHANDFNTHTSNLFYRTNAGTFSIDIGSIEISLDIAHYLEIHYKIGVGVGAVEIFLDGVSIGAVTELTNDNVILEYGRVGYNSSYAPANGEYFHIDDILISTKPIGEYNPIPPETVLNFDSKLYSKATKDSKLYSKATKDSNLYTEVKGDSIL